MGVSKNEVNKDFFKVLVCNFCGKRSTTVEGMYQSTYDSTTVLKYNFGVFLLEFFCYSDSVFGCDIV